MAKKSVDLTTLSGWANLAPGNHTIQIVAKGTGYRDSEKSAGVEVTKPAAAYTDCLTFTGESSEFTLKATNKQWDGTLQWSTDHNTWTTLTGTEAMQSVDKKLYLRGKGNTTFSVDTSAAGVKWQLSAKAGCSGNIQTLLDWETFPTSIASNYCYAGMFQDCLNLTAAPELPATVLSLGCYYIMFQNCTSLTTAPDLPSTILTESCYWGMFRGCTSLTVAPNLPATALAYRCYRDMFYGCTSLFSAPELPATTLLKECYYQMFYECTSLTTAPNLHATTLAENCCYSMFEDCSNLITAPNLPATTLITYCYFAMFRYCRKLKVNISSGNKIFACPSDIPNKAVTEMFYGTGGTFKGTPTAGNTYYWTE